MKKILLYTFIAAASVFTTSCNDYLDCEPITSVSTNVYLYSETDLAAYAAKFYNDSEDEKDDEYGNILPSHGSATYNLGLFQKDNGTDDQTADSPSKLCSCLCRIYHRREVQSLLLPVPSDLLFRAYPPGYHGH
jgi:hypothetical protein